MRTDLFYALRTLRMSPGFTMIAVLALGLGIGANTAIFSLVNAVLIRPLAYKDPGRLVAVFEGIPKAMAKEIPFSAPDFESYRKMTGALEEMAAYQNKSYEISGAGEPDRITGARVSASLFPILGVQPAIGRTFTNEEEKASRPVAVLSHGFWRRKFGADPSIVGKPVILDRRPYTVIGVMPQGFEFPSRGPALNNTPADLYVPMSFTPAELRAFGDMFNHSVIARLKPAVSGAQANSEASTLARRLIEEIYPPLFRRAGFSLTATVAPYRDQVVGQVRTLLVVLLAAVAMVLLIACADVANLMLTRAAARQREMAIRVALGAGRLRLIRQSLVESGALALAGAAIGLLFAQWGTAALVRVAPFNIPRSQDIRIDASVLLFTAALTMATVLLFGLAPAVESARKEIGESLKENSRTGAGGRRQGRMLGALVSVQFALALVLLIGAGLLVRSLERLLATDPGFRPEHVISAHTSLPAATYSQAAHIRGFYDRWLDRVRALPGVKAAAASTYLPLGVRERRSFTIDGQEGAPDGTPSMLAVDWPVGDYFQALGIPLRAGRFFTPQDNAAGALVVIINESLAKHFLPGQVPIGRRLKWGGRGSTSPWMTIVGVVADVKQGPLHSEVVAQAWQPYPQTPDVILAENIVGVWRSLDLIVRTEGDPAALANAIRDEVRRLDPALPLTNVQTLQQMVRNSSGPQRFNTFLLSSFAVAALLLAAIGIGGVLAYAVSQRTQEIGVRMALGATRPDVMKMVLGRGMLLAGAGMAAGLAASFALTQVMSKLLYGVTPRDPWTFLWAPVALALVALLAIWIPARRATRVDPMVALRYE